MSSRDWTLIAFLAVLLNSSCPVAVSDEGEQLAAHDATPLVPEFLCREARAAQVPTLVCRGPGRLRPGETHRLAARP